MYSRRFFSFISSNIFYSCSISYFDFLNLSSFVWYNIENIDKFKYYGFKSGLLNYGFYIWEAIVTTGASSKPPLCSWIIFVPLPEFDDEFLAFDSFDPALEETLYSSIKFYSSSSSSLVYYFCSSSPDDNSAPYSFSVWPLELS